MEGLKYFLNKKVSAFSTWSVNFDMLKIKAVVKNLEKLNMLIKYPSNHWEVFCRTSVPKKIEKSLKNTREAINI